MTSFEKEVALTPCARCGFPMGVSWDGMHYLCHKLATGLITEPEPDSPEHEQLVVEPEREPERATEPKPVRTRCRRRADGTCDLHGEPMIRNNRGHYTCAVRRAESRRRRTT